MSKDIPMASHLLASKVFGVSARKLAESLGPPLIVPIVLYAIGLPLLITGPFVILGSVVGLATYTRTPEGQRPIRYAAAMARHFRGRTEYLWKPPEAGEHDIAHRELIEGWITGRPDTDESDVTDALDRESTVDTDNEGAAEWPVTATTLEEIQND
ncbi:hypothetical protein EXE51_08220 [Halorubrum sp. CGM5_25_10-8B]|uniref:hypothetical protein n=1 Tax=Halorubrum sp. CGM5_25_10-8B TaxID=2518115 RepID=UPI0010F85927|nr:hypothetical protein [Halorubrum sp. CGM5_25_10-8B]TKX37049.1 hypothetical protein EXE51_08220 [Halorubrum sp. CGM5_25_10-8B]